MNKRKTKQRHSGNSVVIQITTTKPIVKTLDRVVETGYFGTTRAAAAERLLAEGLRNLIKDKTLLR